MSRSLAVLPLLLFLTAGLGGCIDQLQQRFDGDVRPGDYLTDDRYTQWVVELDYVGGHRPAASVTDLLKQRIQPLVHKPDGLRIVTDDSLRETDKAWTTQDLLALSEQHQDHKTGDGTVVTHLLFVDGHSAADGENEKVLGVTIGFDLVVIFSETIKQQCTISRIPPCGVSVDRLMGAVTVHEFGHALGLVNRKASDGSIPVPQQTQHEDPDHEGHSRYQDSVMYWAVETSLAIPLLGRELPTEFDRYDKQDLCAAGGRCAG